MSDSANATPAIKLPTPEETEKQIREIAALVPVADAAAAMEALSRAVMQAVIRIDESHNCGLWLKELKLVSHGPGDFELLLDLKNTELVASDIVAEVMKLKQDYHKGNRAINIPSERNQHGDGTSPERAAEGSDVVPAG